MGFLKRIFGGDSGSEGSGSGDAADSKADDALDADAAERAYELEIARAEQDRLDDLKRRQLRYAEYAWQPPPQGGERRADDGEAPDDAVR
jgi:hypothetical protein